MLIEELRRFLNRAREFQKLQLKFRGFDEGLAHIADRLGAVDVHWLFLILERFERLEQVVSQVGQSVLHGYSLSFA